MRVEFIVHQHPNEPPQSGPVQPMIDAGFDSGP
jgi:hypothetical protein